MHTNAIVIEDRLLLIPGKEQMRSAHPDSLSYASARSRQ
jgi:hypothetical protein